MRGFLVLGNAHSCGDCHRGALPAYTYATHKYYLEECTAVLTDVAAAGMLEDEMMVVRWRGVHVHWLHCHVQRDRAIRVSSAHAMPIGDGYMTKRFRLGELGHMVRPPPPHVPIYIG